MLLSTLITRLRRWQPARAAVRPDGPADPARRGFLVATGVFGVLAAAAVVGGRVLVGAANRVSAARSNLRLPAPATPAPAVPAGADLGIEDLSPVPDPQRGLLPHRHRPPGAGHRPDDLVRPGRRHGRGGGLDDLRGAPRAAAGRARRHAHLRLERGRRQPRRQRDLARLPDPRAARARAAAARRRHGAVAQRGRLHRRHPARRADRPGPAEPAGRRHERRAAPARARLPRPHGRARPVRLRLRDQVGRRAQGDDVRGGRGLLDAARLVRPRPDQARLAHRRPRRGRRPRGRSPWPASRGPSTRASAPSRCRSTTGPGSAAELAETTGPDTWRQWRYAWDATPGDHRIAVRATDAKGTLQDPAEAPPAPDGSSGYHSVRVSVR